MARQHGKWDTVIPFEPLWAEYKRVCKKNAAIVLTASQPFTSSLVFSNQADFRYSLVYEKSHATGHLNANRMPMRKHEDILLFGKASTYNPQKQAKQPSKIRPEKRVATSTTCYGSFDPNAGRTEDVGISFPASILCFNNSTTGGDRGIHPTQKPVALFEYLINTYTNPGDLVLDNCIGSGTTAIACLNTGRNYIGFENNEGYYDAALKRIATHSKSTLGQTT